MQEWIFAMLVISVFLIIRDMAKTFLMGKFSDTEDLVPYCENHPEKEKVERYAISFQKLADSFNGMAFRKEYMSKGETEGVLFQTQNLVCAYCFQCEGCWNENLQMMEAGAGELIRSMEDGTESRLRKARAEWNVLCGRPVSFCETLSDCFQKEKQNLIWNNRMIENRLAVAQQLKETAEILKGMAENLYDISCADPIFQESLRRHLKKHQVILKQAWVMDKVEGRRQIFLTLRSRGGQCVSMSEVSQVLSELYHCGMVPVSGSRSIVNGSFHTVHFVADASYQVLYGVSRLTRESESVSGDSYSCNQEEDGTFVMCLSDGMGSGMNACKESEIVIELLEQFLESGFSEETAARMVNSALVLNGREGMFSTVDLCAIDLYTGICRFLKAGAAATFIRRDHWVEAIESESLAAGLVQQLDFETASRKLYHGDYLIMMTDGVLDALPAERQEETMKQIILELKEDAPKEMGRGILQRALGYSDYSVRDDMTVLVAGIWKK